MCLRHCLQVVTAQYAQAQQSKWRSSLQIYSRYTVYIGGISLTHLLHVDTTVVITVVINAFDFIIMFRHALALIVPCNLIVFTEHARIILPYFNDNHAFVFVFRQHARHVCHRPNDKRMASSVWWWRHIGATNSSKLRDYALLIWTNITSRNNDAFVQFHIILISYNCVFVLL